MGPAAERAERASAIVPLAIALFTAAVFSPVLLNEFVRWDDHVVLLNNPHYRGLGWRHIRWMFTNLLLGHYTPLTWLSFGLDYTFWGMNPTGYHLTSLLLHAATAAVFYLVARRLLGHATELTGTPLRLATATAALFFAVHPLRVESVAWATERRDVLSGLFFMLTILAYLRAVAADPQRRRGLLATSIACYVLALASKSIVMTLPVVLVLLDVYPLRRLTGGWRGWIGAPARPVWLEKVPYALLSVAAAAVAYYAHSLVTPPLVFHGWAERLAAIGYALWFYVVKTVLPIGLSPLYEVRFEAAIVPSLLGVLGLTVASVLVRSRWPAGLAAWTAYAILLAPVSGLVDVGVLVADRYSYLASVPWAVLVGAGVGILARAGARGGLGPRLTRGAVGAGVLGLAALALLSWQQALIWRDTESLWRHAVAVTPECASCSVSLGHWLIQHGSPSEGLEHLERALALSPDRVWLHISIATTLGDLGRVPEAIAHYERVLDRCDRDMAPCRQEAAAAHANLGLTLDRLGRAEEARRHFGRAIELEPGLADRLGPALRRATPAAAGPPT